ncbi:MAG: hypothetical protein QOI82_3521 [Actinomycetota bacterium]|nr:hypothetical protein [Actinomycetota bacterium]
MVTVGRHRGLIPSPRAAAVIPLPTEMESLQELYDRYRAVSSRLAPDLVDTPEVVQARAALIRALIADGWKAPEIVQDRLRADEELLRPRLVAAS